jgi:uncharacterized cupin superfamily protein
MKKVTIKDVDTYLGPAAEKRPLGKALGTTDLAVNYYELEPGDSFAFGYHSHGNQEEVFYVQSGVVTFETEEGAVDVSAGEAIRFAPGEFQRGVNESDDDVVALALGAPRESGELEMLRECPDCGEMTENTIEMADDREALVTLCEDCGAVTGRFE